MPLVIKICNILCHVSYIRTCRAKLDKIYTIFLNSP